MKTAVSNQKAMEALGRNGSFTSSVFHGKTCHYQYYEILKKYYFIVGNDSETQCTLSPADLLKLKKQGEA